MITNIIFIFIQKQNLFNQNIQFYSEKLVMHIQVRDVHNIYSLLLLYVILHNYYRKSFTKKINKFDAAFIFLFNANKIRSPITS